MLASALREEFRGRRLEGTAIELASESQTGATQVGAVLLDRHARRAASPEVRTAAARALTNLRGWEEEGRERVQRLPLFLEEAS
jgi:hypothetical protein